jgi:ribosomal protein L12E/L44/L45/RPP1/RPP2
MKQMLKEKFVAAEAKKEEEKIKQSVQKLEQKNLEKDIENLLLSGLARKAAGESEFSNSQKSSSLKS